MVEEKTLSELVELWYSVHGRALKDAKYRLSRVLAVCERLGNPAFKDFSAKNFAEYRALRVLDVKPATVNHELRYLKAVFNELIRLDFLNADNPLNKIRQFPEPETDFSFLTTEQIPILLNACADSENAHLLPVVKLCLATGARFGEVEYLPRTGLLPGKRPLVRFVNTKNYRSRAVPISPELLEEVKTFSNPVTSLRVFENCRSAFASAVRRSRIELPEGQLTHVLRHTFASHFMMNGGDLLTLQRVLGHSDIRITLRYAHLAPDFLNQALELNPLANIKPSLITPPGRYLLGVNFVNP